MVISAFQALRGAQRPVTPSSAAPVLLVAGATGALGNAVLRRLLGTQRYSHAHVLAREPISMGMRSVQMAHMPTDAAGDIAHWPLLQADTAVVMFDPPRMYYERERALFAPTPEQLPALATWLKACGVRSLAIALPHMQGSMPEALKRGLANLDEQAVAALGFERLLIVRSAQKPAANIKRPAPQALAHWMLGALQFMVPSSEQPLRPAKIAEFIDIALQLLPKGSYVAAPELLWQAAQGDVRAVVAQWICSLDRKRL
jgi:hypothetical protein